MAKNKNTDGWISKVWSIHTMQYDLALKRKEILSHTTTGMKLEDIMLSEISQSQKDKYLRDCAHMRSFLRAVKSTETETVMVAPRGWGRGGVLHLKEVFHGDRVSVLQNEELRRCRVVMAAQQCECT